MQEGRGPNRAQIMRANDEWLVGKGKLDDALADLQKLVAKQPIDISPEDVRVNILEAKHMLEINFPTMQSGFTEEDQEELQTNQNSQDSLMSSAVQGIK